MDGPAVQLPRADGGRQRARLEPRGEAGRLRRRRDLRHQQRVRLRLPARQHGLRGRRSRRAGPALFDRRRGGFDPDRRSAHAADHQRPGRRPHRDVRAHRCDRAAVEEADRRGRSAHRRRRDRTGRLHGRREEPADLPHRSGPRERRGAAVEGRPAGRRREPVRPEQHHADAPRVRGAAGEPPVPSRPALRGAERRDHHRRRVHRPPDDGPALERRPAPGRGGEGTRRDPEREPDAGVDHVPELLPHVRQARRHDRHGRHRGLRVPGDLRPRNGGDPAEQADDPQGRARPDLQDRGREVQRRARRHPRLPRPRPADAGGHHVDRELRADLQAARRGQAAAPGAQRQAARQGGRDRRAGRAARRDHDRHQHGRPRHRHRARRQRRKAGAVPRGGRIRGAGREGAAHPQAARRVAGPAREGEGRRRPAHHRHRAPREPAHRQPVARPLGPARATRASRAFTCRSKIR